MMEETWRETDRFICGLLVPSDPALEEALRSSAAAGLPDIQVAPNQGMLLHLLAMAIGSRRLNRWLRTVDVLAVPSSLATSLSLLP